MNFWFTEEQEKFSQEVIDFCKTEPRGEMTSPGFSPSFYTRVAEKGWFGLPIPKEYGGQGQDAIHRVIFMEEMAYWRVPIPLALYGRSMSLFGNICLKHGSEAQKKEYLPKLASGELIFGQTYTEPEVRTKFWRGCEEYEQVHHGMTFAYGPLESIIHVRHGLNQLLLAVDQTNVECIHFGIVTDFHHMLALEIKRINGNHNNLVVILHDHGRNLFNGILLPLPFVSEVEVIPAH